MGVSFHFGSHYCFASLKVKVTKYRMLSNKFQFSPHKLCKNKWIKDYAHKLREKNIFQWVVSFHNIESFVLLLILLIVYKKIMLEPI